MDLVYLCRSGENEELRYSIRSACANLPHKNLWVIGDAPGWFAGNLISRPANSRKYQTTTAHLRAACEDDRISDPFTLLNDDFFIVDRVRTVPLLNRGRISDVIADYHHRGVTGSPYIRGMKQTLALLESLGKKDPLSYELHIPIVVHKKDMLKALGIAEASGIEVPHKRSIYGNLLRAKGKTVEDVKIYRPGQEIPRGPFISTNDHIFNEYIGPLMRWKFPTPSPYESR